MTDNGTPEPTQLQRLLAQGSEVTFKNGISANIVLEARAMAKLEDQYGSLDAYFEALRAATGGKLYHHLAFTFQVCLGMTEQKAWDMIDTKQTTQYLGAIGFAIKEALPELTEEDKAEAKAEADSPNGWTAPDPLPGAASTTSPSLTGTSIPSGSGA